MQARSSGRLTQFHIPPSAYKELREALADTDEADLLQGGVVLDGVVVRPMEVPLAAALLATAYAKLRYHVELDPAVAETITKPITKAEELPTLVPLVVDQWADADPLLCDLSEPENFTTGMKELGLEVAQR